MERIGYAGSVAGVEDHSKINQYYLKFWGIREINFWYITRKGGIDMTITETSKGQTKTINVQRQPHDFIQMLNHLDPFVHEMPLWRNSIVREAMLALMTFNWPAETNASSATLGS